MTSKAAVATKPAAAKRGSADKQLVAKAPGRDDAGAAARFQAKLGRSLTNEPASKRPSEQQLAAPKGGCGTSDCCKRTD